LSIALSEAGSDSGPETRLRFPDPKRINRALFGAWYEEDIYHQLCGRFPRAMRLFRARIPQVMRARNLIFVHVPRVAGTSIVRSLYGEGCIHHYSMRYYATVDPGFAESAPSFALLRDPFHRFASAFAFVRAGGTKTCRLSEVFARQTETLKTVDDYLSFLEARGPLDLDFVMRPQSWFVTEGGSDSGAVLVKDLFILGEDSAALAAYLALHGIGKLPWLNSAPRAPLFLAQSQRRRIERLYADDFALIDSVRRQKRARDEALAAKIAAE
jgi:hypothetical protein